jgi:hypothetical protein
VENPVELKKAEKDGYLSIYQLIGEKKLKDLTAIREENEITEKDLGKLKITIVGSDGVVNPNIFMIITMKDWDGQNSKAEGQEVSVPVFLRNDGGRFFEWLRKCGYQEVEYTQWDGGKMEEIREVMEKGWPPIVAVDWVLNQNKQGKEILPKDNSSMVLGIGGESRQGKSMAAAVLVKLLGENSGLIEGDVLGIRPASLYLDQINQSSETDPEKIVSTMKNVSSISRVWEGGFAQVLKNIGICLGGQDNKLYLLDLPGTSGARPRHTHLGDLLAFTVATAWFKREGVSDPRQEEIEPGVVRDYITQMWNVLEDIEGQSEDMKQRFKAALSEAK